MKTIEHTADFWRYGDLEARKPVTLIQRILANCSHDYGVPKDEDEGEFIYNMILVDLDGERFCEARRWWGVGYDEDGEWFVEDAHGLDELAGALEAALCRLGPNEEQWLAACSSYSYLDVLQAWSWPAVSEPEEEELAELINFNEETEGYWSAGKVFNDVPVLAYRDKTGVRVIVRPGQDDTRDVAASIARVLEDDMDNAILGMEDE